jgi:hypothetical protein
VFTSHLAHPALPRDSAQIENSTLPLFSLLWSPHTSLPKSHWKAKEGAPRGPLFISGSPVTGKVSVPDEELDAMLQEGKGPINFTVFLTLFGEKLNGEPGQ